MSKCSVGYPAGLECAAAANHFSEDWFAAEKGGVGDVGGGDGEVEEVLLCADFNDGKRTYFFAFIQ